MFEEIDIYVQLKAPSVLLHPGIKKEDKWLNGWMDGWVEEEDSLTFLP